MFRSVSSRRSPESSDPALDQETASSMLLVDFEQAFVVHNLYRESERALLKMALQVLAFPLIIAGTIISAKLISSPSQLGSILRLPLIWLAVLAAGLINSMIVRSYVETDRVQTEAKHQVNRLRALYLHALADRFPTGWRPVWGSTSPYLETRIRFKAAILSSVVLGGVNAAYVSFGLDRILFYQANFSWHLPVSIVVGVLHLIVQLEFTWNALRALSKKFRRRSDIARP